LQDFGATLEQKELLREGFVVPFTFGVTQPLVCGQRRSAAERIAAGSSVEGFGPLVPFGYAKILPRLESIRNNNGKKN
jgi:hypothetical protein